MFLGHVDDTLEEVAIVAYDAYLYEYVKKSPKRFALWSSLIEEKIASEKTDTPLEELVTR